VQACPNAEEISIKVPSEDPAKKAKPESEDSGDPAGSNPPKKDTKDGEDLVQIQLLNQTQVLTMFSVRRRSSTKRTTGYVG